MGHPHTTIPIPFAARAVGVLCALLAAGTSFGQAPTTRGPMRATTNAIADAADWPLERVELKNSTVFRGLMQPAGRDWYELTEVVRPPGKPMYLVIRPIGEFQIADWQRLSGDERDQLVKRIAAFRNRAVIEAGQVRDVRLAREPDSGGFVFEGSWFTLHSTADEETTRRCVVRVEQIFRAYRQLLPPRQEPGRRLTILLHGSLGEYEAYLSERKLPRVQWAFYLAEENLVVAGSDLARYSAQLADARIRNAEVKRANDARLADLSERLNRLQKELIKRKVPEQQIRDEMAAHRRTVQEEQAETLAAIKAADRKNEQLFDDVTVQMFMRLYHESFHAYLDQFVYPHESHDVPRWLNEGLAQVFERGQLEADTLRIDAPDQLLLGRLQKSLEEGGIPLSEVLTADAATFLADHTGRASETKPYLYSWGLAYYLTFVGGNLQGERLDQYVADPLGRLPTVERFEALIGMPLSEFEPRWRREMLQLKR